MPKPKLKLPLGPKPGIPVIVFPGGAAGAAGAAGDGVDGLSKRWLTASEGSLSPPAKEVPTRPLPARLPVIVFPSLVIEKVPVFGLLVKVEPSFMVTAQPPVGDGPIEATSGLAILANPAFHPEYSAPYLANCAAMSPGLIGVGLSCSGLNGVGCASGMAVSAAGAVGWLAAVIAAPGNDPPAGGADG